MQRTIVQPADMAQAALAELKGWLGINRPGEDAMLIGLLEASLALCEAFTGQAPLVQTVEEWIPPLAGLHLLTSRPVRALLTAEVIAEDGSRSPIAEDGYSLEWRASGSACVQLTAPLEGRAVALTLTAGIAADWAALPEPLKQGILRLAAHHYRDRDSSRNAAPPASVTALWRPWRSLRLA